MNSEQAHTPEVSTSLLADVVDEITQRLNSGEPVQLDEYTSRYPEIAQTLASLWDVLTLVRQPAVADGGIETVTDGAPHGQLGDFQIVREIGRGGMGVVYEVEQISLRRRMALKVLPFASMLDKQQLKRFKNEARAAATLDHPHIVAVHSVGEERGVHYYAMQLVEGQSLAEVIAGMRERKCSPPQSAGEAHDLGTRGEGAVSACDSPLTPLLLSGERSIHETAPVAALSTIPDTGTQEYFRTIARLGVQAAEALDHAHQNGIVHRDIKPGNLLLDSEGKLYVTDFGLARIDTDAGMTMTVICLARWHT